MFGWLDVAVFSMAKILYLHIFQMTHLTAVLWHHVGVWSLLSPTYLTSLLCLILVFKSTAIATLTSQCVCLCFLEEQQLRVSQRSGFLRPEEEFRCCCVRCTEGHPRRICSKWSLSYRGGNGVRVWIINKWWCLAVPSRLWWISSAQTFHGMDQQK